MTKFLLFVIFTVTVIIFLLGFSAVKTFYEALFGNKTKNTANTGRNNTYTHTAGDQSRPKSRKQKKIFSSNEGEYVDFEEVKKAEEKEK